MDFERKTAMFTRLSPVGFDRRCYVVAGGVADRLWLFLDGIGMRREIRGSGSRDKEAELFRRVCLTSQLKESRSAHSLTAASTPPRATTTARIMHAIDNFRTTSINSLGDLRSR
jgi:hypothetical protein